MTEPEAIPPDRATTDQVGSLAVLSPDLFEIMVRASADGMLAINAQGIVIYANEAAATLLGRDTQTLLGAEFGLPLATGEPVEVELFQTTRGTRVAELRVARGPDGLHVAMLRDVSQRVRLRNELQRLALADQLTGVGNRRAFLALGDQALRLAERENRTVALLFIDVDDMKVINDRYGHRAGDQAVIATAKMLTNTVRESDIVARVGGDEFCVMLTASGRGDSLQEAIQRVRDAAAKIGESVDFPLSVTIGTARFEPDDGRTIDQLMDEADTAMYRAKRARRRTHLALVLGDPVLGERITVALTDLSDVRTVSDTALLTSGAVGPDVDLLVIDADHPGCVGVLSEVRQWPGSAGLPIVVWLPAHDDEGERKAFEAGADEVLAGDTAAPLVRTRLGRLLDRPAH